MRNMSRVVFTIGDIEIPAEFNKSPTAAAIIRALPIEASGSYWGGELYFPIPVESSVEKNAREVVQPGDVAFWPEGNCLCLFWGPTPASHAAECRAASKVNVVGRVLHPERLHTLKARRVRVSHG